LVPIEREVFMHSVTARTRLYLAMVAMVLLSAPLAAAQDARIHRIGVILQGGPWYDVVDGLRDGLIRSGLVEGRQFAMSIRDAGGDLAAAEQAARDFERQKVDLIYTASTSVSLAAKRTTERVPIVFVAGTDPVAMNLVDSIPRPGGRLTGVHTPVTYVTGKRLELLREIVPNVRRVVTFYNPSNAAAAQFAKEARTAAHSLGLEFIERHVASVEALRRALQTFKVGEADAYFAASDAMLDREAHSVIEMASARKLPTMFYQQRAVVDGGLASYSPDFIEVGRLSATYVRRVLAGTNPADLPVEQMDRLIFVINLNTAKRIGLAIPESLLVRADKVIE
jgi:putative ABC transport system substrate-binding protein